MVAVAWMIVIAAYFFDRLGLVRGCAGKDIGRLIEDVGSSATDIEDTAVRRPRARCHIREEVAEATEIAPEGRIIREIAEILGRLVMTDVAVVRRGGAGVSRLGIIGLLLLGTGDGASCETCTI